MFEKLGKNNKSRKNNYGTSTQVVNNKIKIITSDEGKGYFTRGYRLSLPNSQKKEPIHDNAFEFVIIEWKHPNYGYFSDAGFFYTSMHKPSWDFVPIASWMEKYGSEKDFLKEYPMFEELFMKKTLPIKTYHTSMS